MDNDPPVKVIDFFEVKMSPDPVFPVVQAVKHTMIPQVSDNNLGLHDSVVMTGFLRLARSLPRETAHDSLRFVIDFSVTHCSLNATILWRASSAQTWIRSDRGHDLCIVLQTW